MTKILPCCVYIGCKGFVITAPQSCGTDLAYIIYSGFVNIIFARFLDQALLSTPWLIIQ